MTVRIILEIAACPEPDSGGPQRQVPDAAAGRTDRALQQLERLIHDEFEVRVSIANSETLEPAPDFKAPAQQDIRGQRLSLTSSAPRPAAPTFDAAAFLQGLGVKLPPLEAAAARMLGEIMRTTLQGLLDVQQSHLRFENRQRCADEAIEALSRNSPLKTAVTVEAAILALLRPAEAGQLPALQAIQDAFGDIRFHQLSLTAAMRASFDSFTSRFEPSRLMALARQSKLVELANHSRLVELTQHERPVDLATHSRLDSLSILTAKTRYWDKFLDLFEEAILYPEEGLQSGYRQAFCDTYARQLADLKRTDGAQAAA